MAFTQRGLNSSGVDLVPNNTREDATWSTRDRCSIIYRILKAAEKPILKTRIIARVQLNFVMANRYLRFLQLKGLIMDYGDSFLISDKGLAILPSLEAVIEAIGE